MKPPSPTRLEAVASDRPRQRISPALMQRRLRDIHLYLGMLFAPTLLFFALTGALQLYNLHEVRPGRAFEPPALLQKLGMLHKDQEFRLPRRRAAAPPASADPIPAGVSPPPAAAPEAPVTQAPAPQAATPDDRSPPEWAVQVLKAFCLLAALALATSTGLGIWLGVRTGRHRILAWGLLALGVMVPVALLAI